MDELQKFLKYGTNQVINILDATIPLTGYVPIDLSSDNKAIAGKDITDHSVCQKYIDKILSTNKALVAFGGYLEKRSLYSDKAGFNAHGKRRNIHLGMDFWSSSGTEVLVPLNGKVHSFRNNKAHGDYGPTIILEHSINDLDFFTLYGHLSLFSLDGIYSGKKFEKGEVLGRLGPPEVNVGYAPHLHFQIIGDLENNSGDYPGVCSEDEMGFYSRNCPDPNLLLKLN